MILNFLSRFIDQEKSKIPISQLLFASTIALEKALDGSEEAFQQYYFAMYHCLPDDENELNARRIETQKNTQRSQLWSAGALSYLEKLRFKLCQPIIRGSHYKDIPILFANTPAVGLMKLSTNIGRANHCPLTSVKANSPTTLTSTFMHALPSPTDKSLSMKTNNEVI